MDLVMAIKAVAALALVLGLIALLAIVLRRLPGGWASAVQRADGGTVLRVVEMRRLGPRHQLLRIAYGGDEHLLLLGPAGDTLVASRPAGGGEPTEGGAA